MSFHLKYSGLEDSSKYLFSGDIILGSPSAVIEDLPTYMKTLKMLREHEDYHFDYVCVPHSTSLKDTDTDTVMMDGPEKLAAYIKYREDKIMELEMIAKEVCNNTENGHVSRDQLYQGLYGPRNLQGRLI